MNKEFLKILSAKNLSAKMCTRANASFVVERCAVSFMLVLCKCSVLLCSGLIAIACYSKHKIDKCSEICIVYAFYEENI